MAALANEGWGSGNSSRLWLRCGKQHLLVAPARNGKDRQGERRSEGTSAATTSNLLGIIVQQGESYNCKEVEATAVGGGYREDSGNSMLAAAVTGSTVVVLPAEQLWPPRYKEGQRQWQR